MARSTSRTDSFDDAFDDLFADAYRVALDVLGDEQEAEDVAVEATARAYARWSSLQRRAWRTQWVVLSSLMLALDVVGRARPVDRSDNDDAAGGADDELILSIASLPRREREVLALRDLGGLSTEQCAEVLRASERTVAALEGRGRTRLTEAARPRTDAEAHDEVEEGTGDEVSEAEDSADG